MDYWKPTVYEAGGQAPAPLTPLGRMVQPLRFCTVALSALAINMLVLWLLKVQLRVGLLQASAAANEAAVLASFLLNDRWTFAATGRHTPPWRRLLRFNGVALGGVVITVALLGALVTYLSIDLLLANLIAVGAGSLWNYIVASRWAWGRR